MPEDGPARYAPRAVRVFCRIACLLGTALLAAPGLARAETVPPVVEGDRRGVLVPLQPTSIRVERASIAFALAKGLDSAAVTAAYRLGNPSDAVVPLDVAFAFPRASEKDPDPVVALEADGAPVRLRGASCGDLLPVELGFVKNDAASLGCLLFHLELEPHQTRGVTVHHDLNAAVDRTLAVNSTFGFGYLLAPGKRWEGRGALDISVEVPGSARLVSALPFLRNGDSYRVELSTWPAADLRFDVLPLDGLWFGMTEPRGYLAIAVAVMAAVATVLGMAAGRVWSRAREGWRRVAIPLVTAGPLAAVVTFASLVILLSASPPHALGFGRDAFFHGALLVFLAAPLGAAVSSLSRSDRDS
jgi:hypothetical protein